MGKLELQWQYQPTLSTGIGYTKGNVWSRAARRKQRNIIDESTITKSDGEDEAEHAVFGFRIQLKGEEGRPVIQIRWLQGKDSVLFESFCGMLKRQMIA